jgi:hypothetical protein
MMNTKNLNKYVIKNPNKTKYPSIAMTRKSNIIDENEMEYERVIENSKINKDLLANSNLRKGDDIIFKEIYDEENEDELNALKNAHVSNTNINDNGVNNESSSSSNESGSESGSESSDSDGENILIGNKRERNDTEDELDDILETKKAGLILDFKQEKKQAKTAEPKPNYETVYRDKSGKVIKKGEKIEDKKETLVKLNYENLQKWAGGVKQEQLKEEKRKEYLENINKPFANQDIDVAYEEDLKKAYRFGDPMSDLLKSQKMAKGEMPIDQRTLVRGFYLPKCKFQAGINRFNIQPGYRWDGVDRSTGFEGRLLEQRNLAKARDAEYHKIRTEEM